LTPLSARRLLIIGGISLILAGMIFGDIFAIFILHPNAGRIGERLLDAAHAVAAHDSARVLRAFSNIGSLLENRGTKVDTHVHIIDFGYIAFVLALIQPYISLSERRKLQLAILFLVGAVLLSVGVFLIHYVGLTYSPFKVLGWASIAADFGGLLVILGCAGELIGLWRYLRNSASMPNVTDQLLQDRTRPVRALLAGGTLLILAGFLVGAYYAAYDLYRNESAEVSSLNQIIDDSATSQTSSADEAVTAYGMLQADVAVKIAAHSHFIEFGVIAILLAFVQPYIFLPERWKQRWVLVLLLGSLILPVFVLLELRWGLIAGGIADFGGALVIAALLAMLVGILRYKKLDSQLGGAG